ncbi:PH, RCC1 and FYVE domains-containing protein 1 [Raphanus sativus]|uniref:PH, RCC1 and FYVE domains-containing protein 1 n=1 Tax=Raphanus sativus TaxID=3726 RepID=A0A6J0KDN1_RAPSA|nr:PH, RCC1 and FYVE domains-containing protein 1 [Raphanus sativus]
MADLVTFSNASSDHTLEQALVTLKKGSQLLKYGRKGKPKFYPFRLSSDEKSLIWISSSGEKRLKLASVSKIVPGQRTAVFQRYLRPEKDYLSFSLLYNGKKKSLDLICKDKAEAEAWIGGLRTLISAGQGGRSKIDGWNGGNISVDSNSRDLTSSSQSSTSATSHSSPGTPFSFDPVASPKSEVPSTTDSEKSHVLLDTKSMMQTKVPGSDGFRVSVSSAQSSSSHGSAADEADALGDVYIWGEVICDNVVKVGIDKNASYVTTTRTDVLVPKPLESNIVLDVHQIACGVRHAAFVTRQGEIFTWGEESGGRLGHGIGKDVFHPRLVDSLSATTDFVACGEFHTCAVTLTGELYTWGDGTHNVGLLGHGSAISHWIPKRIAGPLEGLHVASVTCGPWHTALVTSHGRLFTFGDGTFGVLGHGDRETVQCPREVESLSGLRTIAVSCGVWHTAAVVEIIVTQSNASSVSSGKLFTWGDGDKNRLGHGDKDARLKPTCVPALIDYNFHRIACGHSLTVGLTTSGQVFTMGSTVYGQLGNLNTDGKLPCLVEDKLASEFVEEISCGAYHVAALTSRNEVYTWGKGANGRLGHGDLEDRKLPTLVEALKDRHVKYIACGSNYTAAICLHRWVSGAEQSQCSACRLAFGFTRKRHNCYNCGLVHCHSCSSKKAFRAALAPSAGRLYRVCDSCYVKLSKVSEMSDANRRIVPRLSGENKDRLDKSEIRLAKFGGASNVDLIKQLDSKAAKQGKKSDSRSSQLPSLLQLKDAVQSNMGRSTPKLAQGPSGGGVISSRSVSPFSRRSSPPPRSATPMPSTSGIYFPVGIANNVKKTNEVLNQEIIKLRTQVDSLTQKCELQEVELQNSVKKTQEALALAEEESAKSRAAKEAIKSLIAQLKDVAEKLPPGESIKLTCLQNGFNFPEENGFLHSRSESMTSSVSSLAPSDFAFANASWSSLQSPKHTPRASERNNNNNNNGYPVDPRLSSSGSVISERHEPFQFQNDNGSSHTGAFDNTNDVEAEWIEQYEPGVYITLVALHDGTRELRRVRFSRRRFGEHQAETWWSENREKVYEKYNVRVSEKPTASQTHRDGDHEEEDVPQ